MANIQAKSASEALVLEAIRRYAPVTRSELARYTGFTPATVTNVVAAMIDAGYVEEGGRRPQGRGQPPIELRIRPGATFTLGAHVEHRDLGVVLVDSDGTVVDQAGERVPPLRPDETVQRVEALCRAILARNGVPMARVLGAGLATFGPIDFAYGTVSPLIYDDEWQNVPIRDWLSQRLGLPVYLDNNATASAIGEYWYGTDRDLGDFLHVFLGFGVGGGLFFGGRVHRGTSFNAGEVGHVITDRQGPSWFQGPPGSLESFVSLLAFERDFGEGALAELEARFGDADPDVLAWLDAAARRLAQVAVSADHLLDLGAVVVGGLYPQQILSHMVDTARPIIEALTMRSRPHRAVLRVATAGPFAAALGAAMLPIYDVFLPAAGPVSLHASPPPVQADGR